MGTALGGGNGGVNVLPSLLGGAMARGLKEVEDGCPEEALASSTGASCVVFFLAWLQAGSRA